MASSLPLVSDVNEAAAVIMATTGAEAILCFTTTALSASTMFADPHVSGQGLPGLLSPYKKQGHHRTQRHQLICHPIGGLAPGLCAVDWGEGLPEVMRLGPLWALMVEVLGSPSPCPRTSGWGLMVGVMGEDAIGCY